MRLLFLFFLLFFSFEQAKDKIVLKTHSGDTITVAKDLIYFNNKKISETIESILYDSKYNRLIEQNASILLFLEIDNSPNSNMLAAFKLTNQRAIKLAECAYNDKKQGAAADPFTDIDNDGKLEFGGTDITEGYEAKDSMYYIPSQYYEIKKGTAVFDSVLTKKMDKKCNGIYLRNPIDENGNCCVVIKKPNKKSSR